MLTATIITIILSVVLGIINTVVPVIGAGMAIPPEVAGSITQVLSLISYFVPIGGLIPMLLIIGVLDGAIIGWRLALRIINFLPVPFIKGS